MTTTALIRKSFPALTNLRPGDEEQGLVEAIVNTTGVVDMQKENLQPGCWTPILKAMQSGEVDYPTILWGHDWQIPVGKVLHAEELMPGDARLKSFKAENAAGGLRIVGQYNLETQRGREAYSDVKGGYIKQWSVGYLPDDSAKFDQKGVLQVAGVAAWPEVSNVLVGASPGTRVTATKTAEEILGDPNLPIHEKALAIEQAYLAAAEEGEGVSVIEALLTRTPDEPQPQPQAETPAEASPTLQQQGEWLINYVADKLSSSKPQHSDPEPEPEDLSMPAWVRQNIRPTI